MQLYDEERVEEACRTEDVEVPTLVECDWKGDEMVKGNGDVSTEVLKVKFAETSSSYGSDGIPFPHPDAELELGAVQHVTASFRISR